MDPTTQKFIEQLRSVTLLDGEREVLRSALISKIRVGGARQAAPSLWLWLLSARRTQATLLSLVIVLGYGSAVSLAAENSLPGDTLYPIKTLVTEPVARLITANTPAKRADFETGLLNERLREAEALDKEMKLDAPLQQTVREEIRKQSIKAETVVRDVPEEDSHALKGVLEEHKHILEELNLTGKDDNGKGKREGRDD